MNTAAPLPRPGPPGLDTDDLRVTFEDLLSDSSGPSGVVDEGGGDGVRDDQVKALDAAHELLADALTALDSQH